jgi:hypothetical protein
VASLFLGKRAIPVLTFASVGSLGVLAYLEIKGEFLPAPVSTDAGFCLSACILLMTSGALVWVILNNTERMFLISESGSGIAQNVSSDPRRSGQGFGIPGQ